MKNIYSFSATDKIKRKLLNQLFYSENLTYYKLYSLLREFYKINSGKPNPHIDDKRQIVFIHSPKVAGRTLRHILKLPKNGIYHHYTPTFLVSPKIWEKYFTIVSVRNPLDRWISAYFHFVSKNYTGYFRRVYPNLPDFSPREFFNICKYEPFLAIHQHRYTRHYLSTKPVDFIVRVENLKEDVILLSKLTQMNLNNKSVPRLGKNRYDKNVILKDKTLVKDIIRYYRQDYSLLGYPMKY